MSSDPRSTDPRSSDPRPSDSRPPESRSAHPTPARSLPPQANLEQQKKQARELLSAAQAHDAEALRRFRTHHPRIAGLSPEQATPDALAPSLALTDAQLVIAREYGFPSWPALKHAIEAQADRHTRPFVKEIGYYDDRAQGLVSARDAGVPQAIQQIREWHPAFEAASDEEIRQAPFDREAARLVYARQHGFPTWEAFGAWIASLAQDPRVEPFMQVFDAMRQQDWTRVHALLDEHPVLVRARGTNGNTLLNLGLSLAGGLCQPVPPPQVLTLLTRFLDDGADVNQANDRGWTPLHQAAYANQVFLAQRLIERGATLTAEAHGEGGTPLAIALFWGHREVADAIAVVGIAPRNLRVAAGLGRADLIDECFTPDGALTAAARAGRGFYRPHSGFPVWQHSDDRQEILDEALVWACKSDRVEVLGALVAHGARLDADPYRGTPLTWAASNGRLATVRWLLDHGASVNQRGTFGGPSHGQGVTALHLCAQSDHLDVARLLVARGADLTIQDALYHSTPEGWASHFERTRTRDFLREAAGGLPGAGPGPRSS